MSSEQNKQVLGIDFGTANSYFCKFFTHPENHRIRVIDFGNGQMGGLASTILYRKGNPPVVGNLAEQEWGEASPAERRNYRLSTHFKPDIVHSSAAREDAVLFLKTLREQMASRRVDFAPDRHQVIVGIPGESDREYRDCISAIARDAGYGEVRLVHEPIGALLYHLWNKDITPSETQQGVLVVDFGGGTCDFAFMQRLEIAHAWGDMDLGGRLFDDLFFQWFLAQNPQALKKLEKEGDAYYVHWLECRKVKEFFSERMAINREENLRSKVGQRDYGTLRDMDWPTFLQRARAYSPHPSFVSYLRERGMTGGPLLAGQALDLLEWFERSLREGLTRHGISGADISKVILTGGSSQWPFVQDIVCRVLHLKPEALLTSENPKAAISEGLVVLPSLQFQYENVSRILQEETGPFFKERIEPLVDGRLNDIIEQIIRDVTVHLYDGKIAPALQRFRENGGTIASLKQTIEEETRGYLPQIEAGIRSRLSDLSAGLPGLLQEQIIRWFTEKGISYYGTAVAPGQIESLFSSSASPAPERLLRLHEEITQITGTIAIGISAVVVANIAGGGGTALIASGPAGWIVGAVAALVAGWFALEAGKEKIGEFVESTPLPAAVVKLLLWESRVKSILEDGRRQLGEQLRREIENAIAGPLTDMRNKIRGNIRREIENLSLINHL
ncbi:MAG: Hsp70 family protein [Calditrichaeota bacterium]|nr:Hsp70 family protein [Calditrichota bacterium]HQU70914.1 Hsp70 family protein [Calditrichia bacterium]